MRIFLLALLVAAPAAQAQMYKCVDARGVTQYADKPCPDGKGKVDIRSQPPISGKAVPQQDMGAAERDFQRRQIERNREAEEAALQAQDMKQRCGAAHTRLEMLTRANTISRLNDKGERVYMDNATRDAQVAQLKAQIAQYCR